jgi:peptidoglycan hydrolase CwlO-like protein
LVVEIETKQIMKMENTKADNSTLFTKAIATWVLGLCLVGAIAMGTYEYNKASEAEEAIREMKVKADSLNFLKNNLQNEIESLNAQLETEMLESSEAEKALAKANEKITIQKKSGYAFKSRQQKELEELRGSKDNDIALLHNQLDALKSDMEKQMEQIPLLQNEVATLENELAKWKADYAKLEKDFNELNKRYARLIYDSPGDNFNVEVLTASNKLTTKAKKADYIKVSFLMPAYDQLNLKENETLYLSLYNEKIEPLSNWIEEANIISPDKSIPIQVHSKQIIKNAGSPQVVEFKVKVDEKLEPGTYSGRVYSKSDYLGTVNFKLRDSFL